VGLGRIGQGYDYHASDDRSILTHTHAYACHEGYELVAAVDTDAAQQKRFTARYACPAYPDVGSMMKRHRPEVVSLCVPTARHLSVFKELISFAPRAVLCEKPMSGSTAEAQEMIRLAERYHCILLVNYIRRSDPGVRTLKEIIHRGDVGELQKGICWYSKGILNNGSHYIDLLRLILGDVTAWHVLECPKHSHVSDPEPDVCLRFGRTPVYLLSVLEECFSVGRLELMGTAGHILYDDFGDVIRIRKVAADSLFPAYRVLERAFEQIPADMGRYQWHVIDQLLRHLTTGESLLADGRSAAETLSVIEGIKVSCKEVHP
jgi:predicted dehydrogenase